ncbi:hypothetical protein Patl1_11624 [Pistacia atlantica]|uniref:Uncharacterized protein n=1 Tax=Pistacia atlantica TaxID=434234 RepID=A0ACC1A4S8_9ROSI|nr:hypothetical protein Patl1_11624 [Pistacia atlantica]
MDGFVLPPFQSTSILKDYDIIRVRKKAVPSSETIELYNGMNALEKSMLPGVKLLAIEEFAKDLGAIKVDQKRLNMTRGRSKLATAEEHPVVVLGDLDNDVLRESLINKDNMPREPEKLSTSKIDEINECMLNANR